METQWTHLLRHASPDATDLLARLAEKHAKAFSDHFYTILLKDERSSNFVSHDAVNDRLHASFQHWITHLFTRVREEEVAGLVAEQKQIGTIHARLNIPLDLVLRASRHMKEAVLAAILSQPGRYKARFDAAVMAMGLIDVAMEIMSAQYGEAHDSVTRTDEAYRNYAATMNMSLERECQRTAISDWSNRLLQDVMIGGGMPFTTLGQSSFGLWIRHKAPAIFSGPRELDAIRRNIETIDRNYLPEIEAALKSGDMETMRRVTRLAIGEAEQARHLLDTLFDHLVRIESGSDALTRLLNRRFLPSILSREIGLARSRNIVFSVMLLDIDNFKSINDHLGHDAGDRTLQQVAQTLTHLSGSGDFVFRYGGEEFLIVCAELDAQKAQAVAERIRKEVGANPIDLAERPPIQITISIGVATYDGHPDYQRLIQNADRALYSAKSTGRNRVVHFTSLQDEAALA